MASHKLQRNIALEKAPQTSSESAENPSILNKYFSNKNMFDRTLLEFFASASGWRRISENIRNNESFFFFGLKQNIPNYSAHFIPFPTEY
jgi:hypothetical protein